MATIEAQVQALSSEVKKVIDAKAEVDRLVKEAQETKEKAEAAIKSQNQAVWLLAAQFLEIMRGEKDWPQLAGRLQGRLHKTDPSIADPLWDKWCNLIGHDMVRACGELETINFNHSMEKWAKQ
jgi:hypothetical protein